MQRSQQPLGRSLGRSPFEYAAQMHRSSLEELHQQFALDRAKPMNSLNEVFDDDALEQVAVRIGSSAHGSSFAEEVSTGF